MDEHALEVVAAVERTHWWYRARRRILGAVVDRRVPRGSPGARVLDLGCGTGANFEVVASRGISIGCDSSRLALSFASERGDYAGLIGGDGTALPFADHSFHGVFATDILEHLDDAAAAVEIRRVLRPRGWAVITVPAFQSLWGPQDEASHHLRRYTRSSLVAVLGKAGLRVSYVSYMNAALFVPIWLVRRTVNALGLPVASENTMHPAWANGILEKIFGVEAHLLPRVSLPFGVSLLCVASRPGGRPLLP